MPATLTPDQEQTARVAVVFFAAGGLIGVGSSALLWSDPPDRFHPGAILVLGVTALAGAGVMQVIPRRAPVSLAIAPFLAIGLTVIAQYAAGPRVPVVVALFITSCVYTATFLARSQAIAAAVSIAVADAALMVLQHGYVAPFAQWLIVVAATTVAGFTVGTIHDRVTRMNRSLALQVASQVAEIQRLEAFRRFLSPQVADAVASGDGERGASVLMAHRRLVAVFFCDLRGFTAFAAEAEPEEVMELLGRYHEQLGATVDRYEATVGMFTGDGLMAYFNDPLPCADPALRAVRMAAELRPDMADLCGDWTRRGFSLGFGAGIALGYATLGMIGFERRRDYTAMGTAVNLAARLCAEARAGQILIDPRTNAAVEGDVETEALGELTLKGFARPVPAFNVVSADPRALA